MLDKLDRAVATGLKDVKDCTVYREDVPQGFQKPCFMVTIYDQNPSAGINRRLKNHVRFDIMYFPEDGAGYQEECWTVGEALTREFRVPEFKIKNRNLKITDKILHFLFDVDYREYLENTDAKMQELSQNTNLKEA
jgi:hypothetical protein